MHAVHSIIRGMQAACLDFSNESYLFTFTACISPYYNQFFANFRQDLRGTDRDSGVKLPDADFV